MGLISREDTMKIYKIKPKNHNYYIFSHIVFGVLFVVKILNAGRNQTNKLYLRIMSVKKRLQWCGRFIS